MNLKKLALWLLVIGLIALIVGAVVGALTFNTVAFKERIAEKRAMFNESVWGDCEKDDVECWAEMKAAYNKDGGDCGWSDKKGKWFWNMMWD